MTCWQSVRGRVMRVTKLDECGTPVEGPCSQVVSKGFVSVAYSAEISEGDEVEVKNAAGELCISDKACDELKWINLTITFCGVDPDLFTLMTGYQTVLDYAGNPVGNRIGQKILCDGGVALEVWSDIPSQRCAETGNRLYGYFLAPWVKSAILNSFAIENDGATFEITARTEKGGNWQNGPYAVDPTDNATPPTAGPLLTPIGPEDHLDIHATSVAPPEPECGCQELVLDPS
ncbi:hypothetical protein [Sphaerimonospora mesophila]|uniref:hypothetical protein n=1 Tax=Sphaerimonospora mesophila TaxID=37483 RepID=UPI000AA4041E